MSQRVSCVKIGVALVVLCCTAAAIADTGANPPATETQMLLYCDQTAGASLHQAAWQRLAHAEGSGFTLVTDANAFIHHLDSSSWRSVTVLTLYTEAEPAYLNTLRAYMQAHSETVATLLLWHSHGTTPPAQTLVRATTASVIWSRGMSGIAYALDATPGQSPGGIDPTHGAYVGYRWPDFAHVVVRDWEPVRSGLAPDGSVQPNGDMDYRQCLSDCQTNFVNTLEQIRVELARRTNVCLTLYGPQCIRGYNADGLQKCMKSAYDAASHNTTTAINDAGYCVELCDLQYTGIQGNP